MRNIHFLKSVFVLALVGPCIGTSAQTIFNYTGAVQTYTVGAGVTNICIDATGASGGTSVSGAVDSGGKGARAECNLSVTPGQVLCLYVGGAGGDGSFSSYAAGGYNGGGSATYYLGSGGGGASDIRIGGTALSNRVVVAGGGGGAGMGTAPTSGYERGGDGGGLVGENGYYNNVTTGGAGGTATAGGAGGGSSMPGSAGSLGTGGAGSSSSYGGAGGGGYYGGGGGSFSGGGGGSSYVTPLATHTVHTRGYNRGNGSITLTAGCLGGTLSAISTTASKVNICPNPATNQLVVTANPVEYDAINITNGIGQQVLQQSFTGTETSINIRTLPAGLYYIQLKGSSGSVIQKFIKK